MLQNACLQHLPPRVTAANLGVVAFSGSTRPGSFLKPIVEPTKEGGNMGDKGEGTARDSDSLCPRRGLLSAQRKMLS